MADTTKIKIGAASVSFGGTDLGHTMGGVTVKYSPEYADVTADQYGKTPVDKALIGEKVEVTVPLAESTVANWNKIAPLSTLAGSGNARATMGKDAGARLLSSAATLVIHPLYNSAGTRTEDFVVYKAVVTSEVPMKYENEKERTIEVTFSALIDTAKTSGNYLAAYGDTAS